MGKMIYLMGKSSTGKDTIYKHLLENKALKLNKVVPYTTRPIRAGEEEGGEYHFTDDAGYTQLLETGKIIEDRVYHTYHGLWRYFMVDDGEIDLDRRNYLVIGTLEAYLKTAAFFGKEKVLPILLEVDDGLRLLRALERERQQDNPKYQELCRRYLADDEDFSAEKIQEAGIRATFNNEDLEMCLGEIEAYVKEQLS